jgi:hypothetical protein
MKVFIAFVFVTVLCSCDINYFPPLTHYNSCTSNCGEHKRVCTEMCKEAENPCKQEYLMCMDTCYSRYRKMLEAEEK